MLEIRELTVTGIIFRIFFSIVLGGIIGLERGLKNRPAGFRTYMLVCIGACEVMLINQYAYQAFGTGDPVRMGAQVVSGIGFLGAGTIIVTKYRQIRGLTTAAGLWAAACIGLAIGIGFYEAAAAGGMAVFLVLTFMNEWDHYIRSNVHVLEAYIELESRVSLREFLANARERDLELSNFQLEHETGQTEDVLSFIVQVRGKKRATQEELARTIRKLEGVKYMEVL